MRLHFLQHIEFEDLGSIKTWADKNGIAVTSTKLYEGQDFPITADFDWLVIMGGLMNVYEENRYPWLKKEKKFIEKAIYEDKTVIGICLGAQLIAEVLGALVYKNAFKEIGWHKVKLIDYGKKSPYFEDVEDEFTVFQWHGDAFELPTAARRIATSEACPNQAFQYSDKVFAFQFHLESNEDSINKLIENCGHELVRAEYVQTKEMIVEKFNEIQGLNSKLYNFLDKLE